MAFCNAIEPAIPADLNHKLEDQAYALVSDASALAGQIHPLVQQSIGDLVRSMNCYYSNLIEGHNTVPRDIERALAQDYSAEPQKRDLQFEAVAHIDVQRRIDSGTDEPGEPAARVYLRWLHREFCSRLPETLLWVGNPDTGERLPITPGEFRTRPVQVGRHLPPSGDALQGCLLRFEEVYSGGMGRFSKVIAVASGHHRLLWIHPFLDGNGRVARLMAHAMFRRLGIGSSLWAVSRGLARNAADYKRLLTAADQPRQSDTDGRGSLSQRALVEFCEFFLRVSIDQVRFMQSILDPGNLLQRMERYCREEGDAKRLPKASYPILREALLQGAVERGTVRQMVGLRERAARNVTADLLARRLLVSDSPRAPLRLGFPVFAVERWFPSLYPADGS